MLHRVHLDIIGVNIDMHEGIFQMYEQSESILDANLQWIFFLCTFRLEEYFH